MKMVYKNIPMDVEDFDDSKGIIKGYGSVFGNVDSDGDIITEKAYNKTLKENGHRVKYCWQHNILEPVAKFTELYTDSKGLAFVAEFAMKSDYCRDKYERIKAGVVEENSVGIGIITSQKSEDSKTNYLNEVKLFEISAVTMAANDLARTLEVKGATKEEMIDVLNRKFDSLARFIKKGNITDETGYAIEGELEALKTLSQRLITKPSMKEDTLPKNEDGIEQALEYLSQKFI